MQWCGYCRVGPRISTASFLARGAEGVCGTHRHVQPGFSVRAPVAQDEAGQSRASHGEEMSAAMKALVLVFGAAMIMAEYGPPRLIGYAEARNMKKTDHRNGMDRSNGLPHRAFAFMAKPPYALPGHCWSDDGGSRWRPCNAAGGGGSGGGGGM